MEWKDFVPALDQKKMVLTPWCETKESEEEVKKRSSEESEGGAAKTLCIPFIQPPLKEGTKCFITGKPATVWCCGAGRIKEEDEEEEELYIT